MILITTILAMAYNDNVYNNNNDFDDGVDISSADASDDSDSDNDGADDLASQDDGYDAINDCECVGDADGDAGKSGVDDSDGAVHDDD